MDKKVIKKYAIITIAMVVLFQLVMLLLRCSVDKMNVNDNNTEKVVESVETINETETQMEKNKVDRTFIRDNEVNSIGALFKNDDVWQEFALTEHFLDKYKSRFDIIPELKYSRDDRLHWYTSFRYKKESPNNVFATAFAEFNDVYLENIDFDEPIGAIRYEMKLYLTENKELNDIEILSKKPFTTEEYVWGHIYPPEINDLEDLIIACGWKVESQEYFQKDYMTENSKIVLNGFTTNGLVDMRTAPFFSNIKWYQDDGTFEYKYETFDGETKGEWDFQAEYRDGSILYYKVVFELDDDRKIKYLEYIPIEPS